MGKSSAIYDKSCNVIPGGVNSPVRAFKAVSGTPRVISHANGAYLWDEDGNKLIDYIGSWGPMIVGHSHPRVTTAIISQIEKGVSYGAPTALELELATKITTLMPNIEQIRMVNSGTEATMSAIRLARAATAKNKIIKFNGCYHGHSDCLLVKAGSGALTFGTPTSPGVLPSFVEHTLTAEFNDIESVKALFAANQNDIAAIIVEPVAGNMNCIPPLPEFLQQLRQLCDENNALLIFDEVMTGFRVGLGGAQALYKVCPDLTTLGKVIGGGLPVGAFGGKKEIMQLLSPVGPVYQAGTLSGNPLAMKAGLATLNLVEQAGFYTAIEAKLERLLSGFQQAAQANNIPLITTQVGTMFGLFFTNKDKIISFNDANACNKEHFNKFFHSMLENGVYLAPSAFEAGFVSSAHSDEIINATIDAANIALSKI